MNYIDSTMEMITTKLKTFLPYDFSIKLILALIGIVIVFGILRLYEINKKEKDID